MARRRKPRRNGPIGYTVAFFAGVIAIPVLYLAGMYVTGKS